MFLNGVYMKVFIAEDDNYICGGLVEILESEGYETLMVVIGI